MLVYSGRKKNVGNVGIKKEDKMVLQIIKKCDKEDFAFLKSKFLSAYANVPEPLRKEIIAIAYDKPFTWKSAKIEITNNTKYPEKINSLSKPSIYRLLDELLGQGIIEKEKGFYAKGVGRKPYVYKSFFSTEELFQIFKEK